MNVVGYIGVVGLCAGVGAECAAQGGVFRERSAWAALIGGIDRSEDFGDYIGDTAFRWAPLEIGGGMSLRQVGTTPLHEFRNFIDAPAFVFPDHNGTAHVSCWVDYPEPGESGIQVEVILERPVVAWGADFWGGATAEKLDVALFNARGVELGVMEATQNHSHEWEFLGFMAEPSDAISRVVFRSRRRFLGTGGEGFGVDNIALKYVDSGGTCYPDCDTGNGRGVLDIFDFLCFQARFAGADPYACDCDRFTGPGVCDIYDFLCFQASFAQGCP